MREFLFAVFRWNWTGINSIRSHNYDGNDYILLNDARFLQDIKQEVEDNDVLSIDMDINSESSSSLEIVEEISRGSKLWKRFARASD